MSRQRRSALPLFLAALMLFSSVLPLADAALSNWSGPSVVQVPTPNGGTTLVDGFEIPLNDTVLDAWLEVSEDGMRDIGTGIEWVADKPGGLNFSFGQTLNTTTYHFGRELSLEANHSVGRIDDFETLQRELVGWDMGGTSGIWEVHDMLGIPGVVNGTGRESSGGLIPIGAAHGRYVAATRAASALPNGVHSWLESPDFPVPSVINELNLTFRHWEHMYTPYAPNGSADGAWVEMSTDQGQTWRYIVPDDGYNNLVDVSAPAPLGAGGPGFRVWASTDATRWTTANFNLDSQQGVANASSLRFRFVVWTDVNSSVQRPGWFLDHVNLTNRGADLGTWFHGNLTDEYAQGANASLVFTVDLSNASGPIMLNYAVDFDLEGNTFDNYFVEYLSAVGAWTGITQPGGIPGAGMLIGGQVYIDDSRGWKRVGHPLPQSLAGNSSVYLRFRVFTDSFPGSGYGGSTIDPPEGVFIDDLEVVSGTGANRRTHLYYNFTNASQGNPVHAGIGVAVDEWQHHTNLGVDGPSYAWDSFEDAPLVPAGWTIDTVRGLGWSFQDWLPNATYGPDQPASGTKIAGIAHSTLYQPDTWTHLTSPPLLVPAASHARISFNSFICAETGWDGGILSVSTDGRTWTPYAQATYDFYDTLQVLNGQSEIYNLWAFDGHNVKPTCEGQRGSANVNKSWVTKEVDVSQYGGQNIQLRFSFFTDTYIESDGWYLDDVGIYVDWFKTEGTWLSDLIDVHRGGLGSLDIRAIVPEGTYVYGQLIGPSGGIYANGTFPLTPLPGSLPDQVRVKLVLGTSNPEQTPRVQELRIGGVRHFDAHDTTNGWQLSGGLNVNRTSGRVTNVGIVTESITGSPIYANAPMRTFDVTGVGAGVLITLTNERGISFHHSVLYNQSVQRVNPLVAYNVEIFLQPGGWLESLRVDGRMLEPALNVTVDVGDDGTADWEFLGSYGRNQLGWQDGFQSLGNPQPGMPDPRRGWLYNGASGPVTDYVLIPDGAFVTGGLLAIELSPSDGGSGLIRDLSVAGVSLLSQRNLSGSETILIPLDGYALQSMNTLQPSWAPTPASSRNWSEVPVTVDFVNNAPQNHALRLSLLGFSYELTENVTGLGPVVRAAVNASTPVEGMHDVPVSVSGDAGGVKLWGGVIHKPRLVDSYVSVPEMLVPGRDLVITTRHTHLFGEVNLDRVDLNLTTHDGTRVTFNVTDLAAGGTFGQIGGGGRIALDANSSVRAITDGYEVEWLFQTRWRWGDEPTLDLSLLSRDFEGVSMNPEGWRIGGGAMAVENDLEIILFEARDERGRLVSDTNSPRYPYQVVSGSTLAVSGAVRFEASNGLTPALDQYVVALALEQDGVETPQLADSGADGLWISDVLLPSGHGEVNLHVVILRVGPLGVPTLGADDVTTGVVAVNLQLDPEPPTLGDLMAHTPTGLRPIDGNVWPPERFLPTSIEVTDAQALGGEVVLHIWRSGLDDADDDGEADESEYLSLRQTPPMQMTGTVRMDFPVIDLLGNGEDAPVSFYVTGEDFAGNQLLDGGGPGLDADLATLVTQANQPTLLSLPSLALDRYEDESLLIGIDHRFEFKLTDGNGLLSLDNITLHLASGIGDEGALYLDPLLGTLTTTQGSGVEPIAAHLLDLGQDAWHIQIDFRLRLDSPEVWRQTAQHPSLVIVENGQTLELGSTDLSHLGWIADANLSLEFVNITDLSPPISAVWNDRIQLQLGDRMEFFGAALHRTSGASVILELDAPFVRCTLDDVEQRPIVWDVPLLSGSGFSDIVEFVTSRWVAPEVTLDCQLWDGDSPLDEVSPISLLVSLDGVAPLLEFSPSSLVSVQSDQLTRQLVSLTVHDAGGMGDASLMIQWSFRRHGVELLGMRGEAELPLATWSGGQWNYVTYLDFDIDASRLTTGDQLVVWVVGTDLAGHALTGPGSEDDPRSPELLVIYFHPVLSDVSSTPEHPLLGDHLLIEARLTNHGNTRGEVKVSLWALSDGDRREVMDEQQFELLPQQSMLVTFSAEAWKLGDLQLYLVLDGDESNLTTVPVGEVYDARGTDTLLKSLASGELSTVGLVVLLFVILLFGSVVMFRRPDDLVDDLLDVDEPPPPSWHPDEWPKGAGPPPEVVTESSRGESPRHEEE